MGVPLTHPRSHARLGSYEGVDGLAVMVSSVREEVKAGLEDGTQQSDGHQEHAARSTNPSGRRPGGPRVDAHDLHDAIDDLADSIGGFT